MSFHPAPHDLRLTALYGCGAALASTVLLGCGSGGASSAPTTTTTQAPEPPPAQTLPPIRADGSRLTAGGRPFFAFGFNYSGAGASPGRHYSFDDPRPATLRRYIAGMGAAHRLGANSLRIYLQLFDFIKRSGGHVAIRHRALANLRQVLAAAADLHLYLDVTGNLVWVPGAAPRWYNRMPARSRWRIQARFWSAVSRVAAPSPAVLCYELTSEPVIATNADRWYAGRFGGFDFVQVIVKHAAPSERESLATAWIKTLKKAIRAHDRQHLIGIGLIPQTEGPFSPRNVAPQLDLLLAHVYPRTGHEAEAEQVVRAFAATGKPVLIGETFMLYSNAATQRRFLLASRRHMSGALTFFPPPPGTKRNKPSRAAAALYRANLREFLSLRRQLERIR